MKNTAFWVLVSTIGLFVLGFVVGRKVREEMEWNELDEI